MFKFFLKLLFKFIVLFLLYININIIMYKNANHSLFLRNITKQIKKKLNFIF
jgi:hypothetical protein